MVQQKLFMLRIVQRRFHKSPEQRMRPVRTGFKLWMGLSCQKPGMRRNLDHLHDSSVWRQTGEKHSVLRENRAEIIIYLIAMAMPLFNVSSAVKGACF